MKKFFIVAALILCAVSCGPRAPKTVEEVACVCPCDSCACDTCTCVSAPADTVMAE